MAAVDGCPHCAGKGEDRLWYGNLFRIVLVHDDGFPGWCRLVWHEHVAEVTDLPADHRGLLFAAVMAIEQALRAELEPDKINIASLATAMPHLHVHVIPRFRDDATYPEPVWLQPVRRPTRVLPESFASRMRARLESTNLG